MQEFTEQMSQILGGYVLHLLGAIAVLVVGWFAAVVLSRSVRWALKRADVDNKVAQWSAEGKPTPVAQWISTGIFYLLLLFVLVAFFQALGLTTMTEPLNNFLNQIFGYAPHLIAPVILIAVAWIVARVLRFLVQRGLSATGLDQRLGSEAGLEAGTQIPLSATLGDTVYWLVLLLFLPAVLDALRLEGLLQPVQGMVNKVLAYLPNVLGAGVILLVGWFVARIVQRIVTGLLAAAGADRVSERVGLATVLGQRHLSGLIGLIVYVLILIPVLISSLNALALDAVTQPASHMLNNMLAAVPGIFAAAVLLILSYVVARVVTGLIANVLEGIGFNRLPEMLGFKQYSSAGSAAPANVVATVVLVTIMLFATIEAFRLLAFVKLADLITEFLLFAGHIVLGLVIFAIGLYVANLVARTVLASKAQQAGVLATAARVAILLLAGAMALRQMGLANEIITLAFGLILGAVVVAAAIAFGIGGRDVAAQALGYLAESLTQKKTRK